jgi:hypothetical protein
MDYRRGVQDFLASRRARITPEQGYARLERGNLTGAGESVQSAASATSDLPPPRSTDTAGRRAQTSAGEYLGPPNHPTTDRPTTRPAPRET